LEGLEARLEKNKDISDVLNKFADSLIDMGGKNEKQALKSRQLTPSRSLFGRVKSIRQESKCIANDAEMASSML
jgi:hypothetical protein